MNYSQWEEHIAGRLPHWWNLSLLAANLHEGGYFTYVGLANRSPDVPAANVELVVEQGPWGIGTPRQVIHTERVFLPSGEVTFVNPTVQLPDPPYPRVLHASIHCPHDDNLDNNHGQSAVNSLDVAPGESARLGIPVRNDAGSARTLHLATHLVRDGDHEDGRVAHGVDRSQLALGPGETQHVWLDAEATIDIPADRVYPVTVMATDDAGRLVGGVTVRVRWRTLE